ncbi:MAG: fumarylacetoacetate hydrolase family protein [candidate division Zixibacteria bacterium]|nr:fumarylacetoacetate hydrolase family protein [candidate division Zixibacteria bacterium]
MNKKLVRYRASGQDQPAYGIVENNLVKTLTGAPWLGGTATSETKELAEVTLLAPVKPSKIVCIGLNYHAHVAASFSADKAPEYPLIFLKPPSAIIGPGDDIIHPPESERVDYEAELGVVIGKTAIRVSEERAMDFVLGFTCANDVTARDLQKKDGQWSRAKGFDTFCPVGPWIVTELNYADVLVEAVHNGRVTQTGRTSQMIFNVPFIISYISGIMTLSPGDLICTGTPSGIQPMKPGDAIEVRIEGIGSLVNRITVATTK